jgi:hypothetical protein
MVSLSASELANLDKAIFKNTELMRLEIQHEGQPRAETMEKLQIARRLKEAKEDRERNLEG